MWRRDERGVSEVISYLFSFAMSFLILTTTLYAFSQVTDSARDLGAQTELRDIANRVAIGIQESILLASARQESRERANSTLLRFDRALLVPYTVQGWDYNVTVDNTSVNATLFQKQVSARVPTFNSAVILPPSASQCSDVYAVCRLNGTALGSNGRIVITYLFNRTQSPMVSNITIS